MKIKVLSPFYDLEEEVDRMAGDEFEVTTKRYTKLKKNLLPGYFEKIEEEEVDGTPLGDETGTETE